MNEYINGYLILRKPEFFTSQGPYTKMWKSESMSYRGIEKLNFADFSESYRNKYLPEALRIKYEQIEENSNDQLFLQMIDNIVDAKELLQFNTRINSLNEIVLVKSDIITKVKGSFQISSDSIEWLGYDLILFGGGSLI